MDCLPTPVDNGCPTCIPEAGGASPQVPATLPFTGIEDVIAPLLLGLVVLLGGVVAWRWAQMREAVAAAAARRREIPARVLRTGYELAARDLVLEQRARQVFRPRVA